MSLNTGFDSGGKQKIGEILTPNSVCTSSPIISTNSAPKYPRTSTNHYRRLPQILPSLQLIYVDPNVPLKHQKNQFRSAITQELINAK